MTQSTHMPPAKKIDRKNTPPQEILATRRSTRTKTSALANKFGNAIPNHTIANDTTADNEVCHIMMQHGNNQNEGSMIQAMGTTHESSTDIECIENNANDETPEQLRIEKTNDKTEEYLNSMRDTASPKDTLCIPTMTTTNSIQQQDNPSDKFVTSIATPKQSGSQQSPNPRAISSRYVIDRPTSTSNSADKSLIDSFNDAMQILKSISPTKSSMTFQRECERQDRPKCPIKYTKAAKSSESIAQHTAQTLAETNAPQTSPLPKEDQDKEPEKI